MLISPNKIKLESFLKFKYAETRDLTNKITDCCCDPILNELTNKYEANCDICKSYSQEEFDSWSKQNDTSA